MERFAHQLFKDVVDGHGTVHARRTKLLATLNALAKENYEAGVEDGKKASTEAAKAPVLPVSGSAPAPAGPVVGGEGGAAAQPGHQANQPGDVG
jgi:hypothetical protein